MRSDKINELCSACLDFQIYIIDTVIYVSQVRFNLHNQYYIKLKKCVCHLVFCIIDNTVLYLRIVYIPRYYREYRDIMSWGLCTINFETWNLKPVPWYCKMYYLNILLFLLINCVFRKDNISMYFNIKVKRFQISHKLMT